MRISSASRPACPEALGARHNVLRTEPHTDKHTSRVRAFGHTAILCFAFWSQKHAGTTWATTKEMGYQPTTRGACREMGTLRGLPEGFSPYEVDQGVRLRPVAKAGVVESPAL